jgi:hypothetical protein
VSEAECMADLMKHGLIVKQDILKDGHREIHVLNLDTR